MKIDLNICFNDNLIQFNHSISLIFCLLDLTKEHLIEQQSKILPNYGNHRALTYCIKY